MITKFADYTNIGMKGRWRDIDRLSELPMIWQMVISEVVKCDIVQFGIRDEKTIYYLSDEIVAL